MNVPQEVQFFNTHKLQQLSCGFAHCCALTVDNQLYVYGKNDKGQLACEGPNSATPQLVQVDENIKTVLCGGFHVFCITFSQKVIAWGRNDNKVCEKFEVGFQTFK